MKNSIFARSTVLLAALTVVLLAYPSAQGAATIVIANDDAPNVGFNDPTPVAPVGGNPGTTLGQQRLNAFQHAADIWGATLTSGPTITVRATWEALECTSNSAVLGSAGAATIRQNFPGAVFGGTWYGAALANKLAGSDSSAIAEINARFNVNIGTPGCFQNSHWYYGLDSNHGTDGIDLIAVLLHELSHGLGFQSFTNASNGVQNSGAPSIYDRFLFDNTAQKAWVDMTNAERQASAINTGNLVWTGPQVTNDLPSVLTGNPRLRVNSPGSIAGSYLVGTADFGPALTIAGVTGNVVQALDPDTDGCSPITNASSVSGKIALVDRGSCNFVVKVKNAQNAGAIAVIVVNNVQTPPLLAMGGTDPTITVPALLISIFDGDSIKGELANGVNATLGLDSVVSGADAAGRAQLFAPSGFQGGSSVSHWDSAAFPNQLMEPDISSNLTHNVTPPFDLTLSMLIDIGWAAPSAPTPTPTPSPSPLASPTPGQYAVSGRVADGGNNPVSGVTITFDMNLMGTMTRRTTSTDASGNYASPDLGCQDNVLVTPSKIGYTFSPQSISFVSSGCLSGAGVANFTATPPPPNTIQFSTTSYSKPENGPSTNITVTRTGNTSATAAVDFRTEGNGYVACNVFNGSAVQNCDFILNQGTLNFAAGQTSRTFPIIINDDTYVEGDETLGLTLSNPVGATLGTPSNATLTITDNDTAGAPSPGPKTFIAALSSGQEVPPSGTNGKGGGIVQLDTAETGAKVGLLFSSLSSTQTDAHIHGAPVGTNGPIVFPLPLGTVIDHNISPTAQQVADLKAGLLYMNVHSSNFTGGEIRGQLLWNPLNEPVYLVTQHYYDFLGRLPDQGGQDFWVNSLTACGINVQCLRDQTVGVSNAFFYEQEYQQTASYVFLLYRAAYGNTQPFPNPDPNVTEAQKLPRYLTFVRDRAQVVGGTELANSQSALANAFVQRPEFIAKYPLSLATGAQFVDAVLATIQSASGVDLSSQSTTLINHFNNGGRGLVMFHLANDYWNGCERMPGSPTAPCVPSGFGAAVDNRVFIDAEYNRSFVYSQYSGYLRRDSDMGGFLFWLNQVSTAPPRNVAKQKAMVCSFITSDEYQFRFGDKAPRTNVECLP